MELVRLVVEGVMAVLVVVVAGVAIAMAHGASRTWTRPWCW